MNYLAHAYLSFHNPEILAGNIMSDFVKGKKKFGYTAGIQGGIALHRAIDSFTDEHPITREAKAVFHPHYRLYSGAFTDVAYDHFLATDAAIFKDQASLLSFSLATYADLGAFQPVFPPAFVRFFQYMSTENWLYNYRFPEGMQQSFRGLAYRAVYLEEGDTAFRLFRENYDLLRDCYQRFFPLLKQFTLDNFPGSVPLNS